ncbi:ankyrin repeat domain-containing protein 12 isoform X2 [Xenopus laevis]|uniref:Ankyrin repeat domain-containing protein 12 isoform X2 n=1 Tax=Xenopus laevis TaxID=8355 RepID=A0A8J0VLE9_XENLA|nr:ankyrin repeat domain-containing protein 12 isoform X2 [Xenopus laevis]
MPKTLSSKATPSENSDSDCNIMVEKPTGRKNKEKISSFNRTPKLDRSDISKEMKEKSSMKRKLPFTLSPTRTEDRDSDTEKEGPEKKKIKRESGSKKSTPVNILFGYPLSERKQMALLMQMTARDNSPDSTPNHPSQATPTQKKTPSSSTRQKDKVNKRNERGETPLHMAAIRGDISQVKELICMGANVNVKDFAGWTPLHEACNMGYYDVAKVLIAAGADVNTQGLDDDTPLHDAASSGHRDIVKLLLRHGGNAFQANKHGARPVDVAETEELEQLLKREVPISDDDESYADSEEPQFNNLSSVDENLDSEGEKESLINESKHVAIKGTPCTSGLDEYEFKDDEDDDDEPEISKMFDKHMLRNDIKNENTEARTNDSFFIKQEKVDFPKMYKNRKPKPSRLLFSSSDSSDDDLLPDKGSLMSDSLSSDIRPKKEYSALHEQKEKGKVRRKLKNQSKNKENQQLKQERDKKENMKVINMVVCPSIDSLDKSKEEDMFRKSLCTKEEPSLQLFQIAPGKSPKHTYTFIDKQSIPLKQENTKMCVSPPGGSESSLQTDLFRYAQSTDAEYAIESSSSSFSKYKEKSKHLKECFIEYTDKSILKCKEEGKSPSFEASECMPKKSDKEGKIVKKHKIKHKEKEKEKSRKDPDENDRTKHTGNNRNIQRQIEFDREFWKENFFKSDENDEEFLIMDSKNTLSEKKVKLEKSPAKEDHLDRENHILLENVKDGEEEPSKLDQENTQKEEKGKDCNSDANGLHLVKEKETKFVPLNISVKEESLQIDKETDAEKAFKEGKEKSEKRSALKERDLEKKSTDKEKKAKSDHKSEREKVEMPENTDKSKSHLQSPDKLQKESDKIRTSAVGKKNDDKSKDRKDRNEKDKHLGEHKLCTDRKPKHAEKDSESSRADKTKRREKEFRKKSREVDYYAGASDKHVQEERKQSGNTDGSKILHEKPAVVKEKLKEEQQKVPEHKEKDRKDKEKDIDRYKERDKHKDKTQTNIPKLKPKDSEAEKCKSKLQSSKDTRPKEKRLVNDDLMKTSFERMLSLKDLEIEQWHKKHKEKIKQKERLRHRNSVELTKIKEKIKHSPTPSKNKELTRSKSSELSDVYTKEKSLKEATSCRSNSVDAKNLTASGKTLLILENSNITRSPRSESEKTGLCSRSVSMISVASSEESCHASVTTPRPTTEYDSDFALEGSDSQMAFSQSPFLPTAKSPATHDRDLDSIAELPDRVKPLVTNRLLPGYFRSASVEDVKLAIGECRPVVEVRRCSMPAALVDQVKPTQMLENNIPEVPSSVKMTPNRCVSPKPEVLPASEKDTHNSTYLPVSCKKSLSFSKHALDESFISPSTQASEGSCLQSGTESPVTQIATPVAFECEHAKLSCSENDAPVLSENQPCQEMLSSREENTPPVIQQCPVLPPQTQSNFVVNTTVSDPLCFSNTDPPIHYKQVHANVKEEQSHCANSSFVKAGETVSEVKLIQTEDRSLCSSESNVNSPTIESIKIDEAMQVSTEINTDISLSNPDFEERTVQDNIADSESTPKQDKFIIESAPSSTLIDVKSDADVVKGCETTEITKDSPDQQVIPQECSVHTNESPKTEQPHCLLSIMDSLLPQQGQDVQNFSQSAKMEAEENAEEKAEQQEIPQRITRNRANMLANQNKQVQTNYFHSSDKETVESMSLRGRIRLTEDDDDVQVHHPRKRKMARASQPGLANSSVMQAKEKTQQSLAAVVDSLKLDDIQPYQTERANPYFEYLHIRRKVEERRKMLCSVIPQAPQFYDEYVTFNGSYLLDGNPFSKLCIPTITPPPSLAEPLKELFRQQEVVRMKLRLQHSIEREKLIVSNEQEVLRVHYRAARTLANQSLPFSACTVLLDAEVYNVPQESQTEDGKASVRDRFNARQFMSWLQDVDDKFDKLKTCLLMRQQHEAAALNAVQRLEWQLKLQELDPAAYKSVSIYEIQEFYVPLVEVNDDFELTPI